MTSEPNDGTSDLSRLLYQLIVQSPRPGLPSIEQIAENMGCSAIQIYKIIEGERSLKAEDFPRFYRFLGEPRDLLNFMVRKCNPDLAVISMNGRKINGLIEDELENITILLGRIIDANVKAREDGTYSENEVSKLRKKFIEMIEVAKDGLKELEKLKEKRE